MTGTGEKKCMPTNCARRAAGSAAARRVIEIDDVLLARMADSGADPAISANSFLLHRLVLEDGFDDQLG